MAKFCKNCGHELPENAVFCGECGRPVEKEPAVTEIVPAPAAPKQTAPAPKPEAAQASGKTLSLWAYVGLFLLFNLPFVGWIICIVMAFAPKNANIRHFAGGLIVYTLIMAILAVGIFLALRVLLAPVIAEIREEIAESFNEGFTEAFGSSFAGVLGSMSPEEQAALGNELADLFGSLTPEQQNQLSQALMTA